MAVLITCAGSGAGFRSRVFGGAVPASEWVVVFGRGSERVLERVLEWGAGAGSRAGSGASSGAGASCQ